MARWSQFLRFPKTGTPRLVALSQLGCVATLAVLLTARWRSNDVVTDSAFVIALVAFAVAAAAIARATRGVPRVVFATFATIAVLVGGAQLYVDIAPGSSIFLTLHSASGLEQAVIVATLNALLPLYGGFVLASARAAASDFQLSIVAERELSSGLEHAIAARTVELQDVQRVLERMSWLGQQIALELNPQRVLERFLEAAVDIAQAEGGAVGLVGEDGTIRIVVGTGLGAAAVGHQMPAGASAMGRVIRSGKLWSVSDVAIYRDHLDPSSFELIAGDVRGLAIIPISRRGERIGAVVIGSSAPRAFSPLELERVESMADLLSVALENAELVETLRQAEWRFRTLFRAAPDAVFTVLQGGRIREANDAVRDVTGYDPPQLVGRELADFVIASDGARLKDALEAAFAGTATRLEVTMLHETTGARRIVALAMSRLPQAEPPTVLLVGRDMTGEREMRVRLMESDRLAAVGELVAGVAHEVNNPLSSISAFAQLLLRDGVLSTEQRESIEVIKSETARASQVVKDLLAFARRSEPQREPIDLNTVIARTLRLRGYQLTSGNIRVEQALDADIPAVMGDGRQLQQVCLNLVTNAIQAMAGLGGGTLTLTTRAGQDHVILEMRDTGTGIPKAVQARIFEPFFTTKDEGEGTGLGLSVSYGIVTTHGGTVEVSDTSPAGTTFRVTLPAANTPPTSAPRRASGPFTLRSPLSGIRLLFVDGEAALRRGMKSYGDLRGIDVVTAEDGEQALEVIGTTGIDAVVCELHMAGMDGMTLQEHIRRDRPGLAARTVFITGDAVSTGRPTTTRQPVLSKPFTFERLEDALVAVMRGSPYQAPPDTAGAPPTLPAAAARRL